MMIGGPPFPSPLPQVLQTWRDALANHAFPSLSFQCLPVQHTEVSVRTEGEETHPLDSIARFALTTISRGEAAHFFRIESRHSWHPVVGPTLNELLRAKLVTNDSANAWAITEAGKSALRHGKFTCPTTIRQVVSTLDRRPWANPQRLSGVDSSWLRAWPGSMKWASVLTGDALRILFPEVPFILDDDPRHIPIVRMQYLPVVMGFGAETDERKWFVVNMDDWSLVRTEPLG